MHIVNVVQQLIKDYMYTILSGFLLHKLLSTTSRISPFDESLIKWHSQWEAWFMIFDSSKGLLERSDEHFKWGTPHRVINEQFWVINEQFLTKMFSWTIILNWKNFVKCWKFWKILKYSEKFWKILENSGKFWKFWKILDVENRLWKSDSGFFWQNDFGQKFS